VKHHLVTAIVLGGSAAILAASGISFAQGGPVNVGNPPIIWASANRQVLKVGMHATIIEHVANAAGHIELYNVTNHRYLKGNFLGGGTIGYVVSSTTPEIVTYEPVVIEGGFLPVKAGPAISIEWQSEANSTSDSYVSPNGGSANADYYTTGASSTEPIESTIIGQYNMGHTVGYNSEAFAEDYGGGVLENWTDLSNGATTSPNYSWSVPSNGKPMFYQMTAYVVPIINGSYDYSDQAKAYAPTYVANEPANRFNIPERATLGTNLTISGLPAGSVVWFTYIGFNTPNLKWQTVAANTNGLVVIPLNQLGAIKLLVNGTLNYVNVQSPPLTH